MRIVNWLNLNQGFVMAVLTSVYVIATIVIVGLSVKTTRLAQKNLDMALQLERNRVRPYVIFNISSSTVRKITYASIKNRGLSAAYNIKVSIKPSLVLHHDRQSPLTDRDILFLPPDQEITDSLGSSPEFHQTYPEPLFEGKVEYGDLDGNKYNEPFRMDLTYLKKRMYIRDPSIGEELKRLNETMTLIYRNLKSKDSEVDESETSLTSLEAGSSTDN